jgi:hypothetical protein
MKKNSSSLHLPGKDMALTTSKCAETPSKRLMNSTRKENVEHMFYR